MNILFLTDNFPPEGNAPANRTFEHCTEWQKKGAQVTVITCAPNFPKGKVFEGYKNKLYQTEMMDGIKVIRVWSYISANQGTFKRTLDYLSFCIMSFFASLFVKTDIIIATSPQFFTAISGYFAALFKRKPWIMEVRDLWPESIKAVNAINQSKVIDFLEKVELFLYRKANRVVVVTEAFKKNIIERGIDPAKIDVIKNGVVLDKYQAQEKDLDLLKKLQLDQKFVLGYLGTHGMAHKLDFILRCAAKVKDPQIHFLFIGAGAMKETLLQLKEELQLTNVTMLAPIPKKEVVDYISIIDVALVPLKKSDTFKTVIPSKIFENAAMGKPIFLGVEGESQAIIENYEAGLCFEPENEADFLMKLDQLKNDQTRFAAYKKGCSVLAKDFSRKKLAAKMFLIICKIIPGVSQLKKQESI